MWTSHAPKTGAFEFRRELGRPVVTLNGEEIRPVLCRHSTTGWEWGYGGSGPADLALNILALFVGPRWAELWYQDFKWDFIAGLPRFGGHLPVATVRAWIERRVAELPVPAAPPLDPGLEDW